MSNREWDVAGFARDQAVCLVRRGLNPLNAVLLASRGITDENEIARLLDESKEVLHDPLLLPDMTAAAERLRLAIGRRERVAVYGDYDVDGITASCLMALYLREKGLDCRVYIPKRFDEGYGVKKCGLDQLHEAGATLCITVDCGVTAVEETEHARSLGMDMIITDHHECGDTLPRAAAVVNPRREDSAYPNRDLAGVGVAFKTICAAEGGDPMALLDRYGDLVMMGTVADVMSVVGENRLLLRRGLAVFARGERPGLRCLCEQAGIKYGEICAQAVGFTLAPRLNAAGRMGSTETALELVTTGDELRAAELAETLCRLNVQRKEQEQAVYAEAEELLRQNPPEDEPIILAREGWNQGVAGIVASRLAEKHGLPAIIISCGGGVGKGSCRSIPGFNVFAGLEASGDLLESYGGHSMAAGLNIRTEMLPAFRERMRQRFRARREQLPPPGLRVDFIVKKPELLTTENVTALDLLEPFGTDFPSPVLALEDTSVEAIQPISDGRHVKFWIRKGERTFECVAFNRTSEQLGLGRGSVIDLAFIPRINEFRGRRSVQLSVVDVRNQS